MIKETIAAHSQFEVMVLNVFCKLQGARILLKSNDCYLLSQSTTPEVAHSAKVLKQRTENPGYYIQVKVQH